ncbi:MAG: hypothetical protein R3229_06640 [Alphaproteobacteria bacterium]|nr:hypothetical protein [Alphaproteobacteria bacterium]
MERFFSAEYTLLWAVVLAALLFYPLRQLIWVLAVRRAERDGELAEDRRQALKRRAAVTAALLGFVFSYFYTLQLFKGS